MQTAKHRRHDFYPYKGERFYKKTRLYQWRLGRENCFITLRVKCNVLYNREMKICLGGHWGTGLVIQRMRKWGFHLAGHQSWATEVNRSRQSRGIGGLLSWFHKGPHLTLLPVADVSFPLKLHIVLNKWSLQSHLAELIRTPAWFQNEGPIPQRTVITFKSSIRVGVTCNAKGIGALRLYSRQKNCTPVTLKFFSHLKTHFLS